MLAAIPHRRRGASAEDIQSSDRVEFWEASASSLFGALRVEPYSSEPFRASLDYVNVGDMILFRLFSQVPHRVVREASIARRDGRAFVKAVLQTKGHSLLHQDGRSATLADGEWTLYDAEQAYSVSVPGQSGLCILMIPRDRVLAWDIDAGSHFLRRLPANRGLGKLIWSLLSTTAEEVPAMQHRSSYDVADIVAQLIRLALNEAAGGRDAVNSRDALRERVKLYISSHLDDPDLSIARLASVVCCSKRYLHIIFQSENASISDYILRARLERCRADLLNSGGPRRSITEIAYAWGFSSSSHFSRCFKRAFGLAPRDLRAEFSASLNEVPSAPASHC